MLSPNARQYIEASVPVLREHGSAITNCFYGKMFAAHPELKNLFNMGNQQSGVQQQSLASALYAYAANIDNQQALAPVISRIVHKHVSIGIRAEHYPIVGKYLLEGIADTLGTAATPELLAAWGEAYGLLAGAFIAEEQSLYSAKNIEPGQCRAVKVLRKQQESADVSSFYLISADDAPLPSFRPGQYISVTMNVAELSLRQLRQYSLSDSPSKDYWRISVKREAATAAQPAGMVSGLMHEVQEGDTLWVGPPCGDFVMDEQSQAPLVLISAGVGITPMMSMLHSSLGAAPARRVSFLHAARNGRHHSLRSELADLNNQHAALDTHICYENPDLEDQAGSDFDQAGLLQLAPLANDLLPQDGQYYLCGPSPFMQMQRKALIARGIPAEQIRHEVFGPDLVGNLK
jgi:nitric oxide dioxygenase